MSKGILRGWILTLVTAVATLGSASAQVVEDSTRTTGWPRGSLGELRYFVDAAQFRGVQGFTLQEFYTTLDARQLQFVPEAGRYVAQVDLWMTITDGQGQPAGEERWTRNFSVDDIKELRTTGGFVRDQIGFSLKPGTYTVSVEVDDIYGDVQGKVTSELVVEGFESGGLVSSDVLFASGVQQATEDGRFVRNGLEVVPRTTRIFKMGTPVRFYHEVYNLTPGSSPGAFDVRYTLQTLDGVPVGDPVEHRYKKGGESAVLTDSVSTEGIEAGRYHLDVQVLDLDSRTRASRKAVVFLQPEGGIEADLTVDQRKSLAYYRHIKWVGEPKDLKTYDSLKSLEARDSFLKAFWKRQDPTPTTVINERLIEHVRRMRYAENNFSGAAKQKGYDTDKGRVYVTYGPPTGRDYRSAVENVKPYEVWTYDTQGTYEFIFRDRRGLGIFELVHSTYPGELYNPEWRNEI